VNDGLHLWSLRWVAPRDSEVVMGHPDDEGVTVLLLPDNLASYVVETHNAEVLAAREARPGIPDLEAWVSRVLAGALRELIRGALPWRRSRRRSTTGDDTVDGGGHRG